VKPVPSGELEVHESRKPFTVKLHTGGRSLLGVVLLFEEGSAELDARAQQELQQFVAMLAGKPQKIEIRGHASRRPLPHGSDFHDAWQLSYARCLSTMRFLSDQGISPVRFRLSQAGAHEPYREGNEIHALADSRVEVFMLSELAEQLVGTPHVPQWDPPQTGHMETSTPIATDVPGRASQPSPESQSTPEPSHGEAVH
jgi:hypothetical protein